MLIHLFDLHMPKESNLSWGMAEKLLVDRKLSVGEPLILRTC